MKTIFIPTAKIVVLINRDICCAEGNPHYLLKPGAVESALHSAFYPGDAPFAHGGIVSVAGALAFYLCKSHAFQDGNKPAALVASTLFMDENGWDLRYPLQPNALAEAIERCARGDVEIDQLKQWYETHKVPVRN